MNRSPDATAEQPGSRGNEPRIIRVCRLCLRERDLCESHILPEFILRPTYDEKHRAILFEADELRRSVRQKGFWEELLCQECEKNLSQIEGQFAQDWFRRPRRPSVLHGSAVAIRGLDYKCIKLLLLSIFWRASVSALRWFEVINLGQHEEEIRRLVLADDPGSPDQYPLLAIALRDDQGGGFKDDLVSLPGVAWLENRPIYRVGFGGVLWYMAVSAEPFQGSYCLSADGTLQLGVEDWLKNPDVLLAAEDLQRFDRRRSKRTD